MAEFNHCLFVGRVGIDPELRETNVQVLIGINRSPNRGFRRGESGWVDVVWAFMVARGEGHAGHASMSERFSSTYGGRP